MARRVIEYLDAAARKYPEKTAFADAEKEISYSALRKTARSIGKSILSQGICRGSVAVLMEKNVDCAAAFLGVAYSGSFYCRAAKYHPLRAGGEAADHLPLFKGKTGRNILFRNGAGL